MPSALVILAVAAMSDLRKAATSSGVPPTTSTLWLKKRSFTSGLKSTGNVEAAKAVGRAIATRAKAAGVSKVAFDRSGFQFHGRVKALADAAREAGLEF